MDASDLAQDMLRWERVQREADDLREDIERSVLALGKTLTVGNVRASYSNGRKSYDYKAAATSSPAVTGDIMAPHGQMVYDWRAICQDAAIEDIPFTQSEPSVTVKLVRGKS